MFRLVSLNLNGIRSAAAKGFEAWAEGLGADCMGVQEIKARADTIIDRFDTIAGMKGHFHFAEKTGYGGVGLYNRRSSTPKGASSRRASIARRARACRASASSAATEIDLRNWKGNREQRFSDHAPVVIDNALKL